MKTFFALTTGLLAGFMVGGLFVLGCANEAVERAKNNKCEKYGFDEEYQPKHAKESEQNA